MEEGRRKKEKELNAAEGRGTDGAVNERGEGGGR